MKSYLTDAPAPIYHYVFVRPDPSGGYTAGVLGLSEICITAGTEHEAVQAVMRALDQWLTTTRWVQVRVPETTPVHPAVQFVGHAKDDPDHEEYLEILRKMREEDRERTLREYEEEDRRAAGQPAPSAATNGAPSNASLRPEIAGREE